MTEGKRAFKGIWIPSEIWLSKDLTVMEKLFLVEIDSLDNEEGCYASNEYFSKFFDLSKNRCTEIIKSLCNKGYLTIQYEYGENTKNITKRILRVTDNFLGIRKTEHPIRKTEGGIRKTEEGYSEKCEDNNTGFNNTFNNIKHICAKQDIARACDEIWSLYPKKKGKATAYKKIPKLIKEYSLEEIKRCVNRYNAEIKAKGTDMQFIKQGDTFFNSGYVDYLDENYKEVSPSNKIKPSNSFSTNKNNIPTVKTRYHNINETFRQYDPNELERLLRESQKGKF